MKKLKIIILLVIAAALLVVAVTNIAMVASASGKILTSGQAAELEDIDCIIVLGCQVRSDGTPSDMLKDRLDRGLELYSLGTAPKLLMSGDHGQTDYNEVGTMKAYAVDNGVGSEDVFMDHAGFSTYETMYRAASVFKAERVVIVTQKYHLYRALYLAESLGLEAYGVAADYHSYSGQSYRDLRELMARTKDFFMALVQPDPTFVGEPIPITGSGDLTND